VARGDVADEPSRAGRAHRRRRDRGRRLEGQLAGSIRIHDASPDVAEFGLLVAAPKYRSIGVGRALVDFAEWSAAQRGMRVMQLELLVPRAWRHPSKEFLSAWYGRRGYRVIDARSIDDALPPSRPAPRHIVRPHGLREAADLRRHVRRPGMIRSLQAYFLTR
jgi:GNAT superfamily N-acetyltransferase